MSFAGQRQYSNAILRPIAVANPSQVPSISDRNALPLALYRQQPTTSSLWTATTHTFIGTAGRVNPLSWNASKFQEDPSLIPDDPKYNVGHDSVGESIPGTYNLFGDAGSDEVPPPRMAVKRYIPNRRSSQGISLLMLPGMGLPKEVFEPMIDILLSKNHNIAEMWTVDMPFAGETALVNPIGYLYGNEKDIARDLLLFCTAYLPLEPGKDLPAELQPRRFEFKSRPDLHVVAHSLGAQSAMLIAQHAPDLFSSLTLFDPAFIPDGKIRAAFAGMPKDVLCNGIAFRHKDRAALAEHISKGRRTRGWDKRIQAIFAERAAFNDGQNFRLTAHPRLEWALYYDQETPTHCYERLGDLQVPVNFVMPARPFAVPPAMLKAGVAKLTQKTRLSWISEASHQLPFEKIEECADLTSQWLGDVAPGSKEKL